MRRLIPTYHLFGLFAAAFGLAIGSFLNVCIARMPEDRSVVWPGSACPSCGHPIRPWDNVPVLSWLLLRGRCRDCKAPIARLYPLVEALTGAVAWLVYRRVFRDAGDLDLPHLAGFLLLFGFAAMLVGQTFTDVRHSIIPDEFTIYAVPFAVAGWAATDALGWPDALSWRQSVVGALAGGGVLILVMGTWWLVRRVDAMGWGDVKLLAMIGSFLGAIPAVPFVLVTSAAVGSVVGIGLALFRRKGLGLAVPFGPFLALGAMVFLLRGPELVERWLPGLSLLFGPPVGR